MQRLYAQHCSAHYTILYPHAHATVFFENKSRKKEGKSTKKKENFKILYVVKEKNVNMLKRMVC